MLRVRSFLRKRNLLISVPTSSLLLQSPPNALHFLTCRLRRPGANPHKRYHSTVYNEPGLSVAVEAAKGE